MTIEKRVFDLEQSVKEIQKDISRVSREIESLKKSVKQVFSLFKEDPETSLMKARKTAERIAKNLYNHFDCQAINNKKPASKMMLDELINIIRRKEIPRLVIDNLVNIQNLGNFATHDQGDENETISIESALPAMASLGYVTSWYLQEICGEDFHVPELRIPVNISNQQTPKAIITVPEKPLSSLQKPIKTHEEQPLKNNSFPGMSPLGVVDLRARQKIQEIMSKCSFDLNKLVKELSKENFRIMSNGRDLVVKCPPKNANLTEPTLLVITKDGEVEIVPKWIVPAIEKVFNDDHMIKKIFQSLIDELIPYKFTHPTYSHSFYLKIQGSEEKIVAALSTFLRNIESFERSIEKQAKANLNE